MATLFIILRGFHLWRFNSLEDFFWYIIGAVILVVISSVIAIFVFKPDDKTIHESSTTQENTLKRTLRKLFESDDSEEMY